MVAGQNEQKPPHSRKLIVRWDDPTCCAMLAADMLSRTLFPSMVLFIKRILMPLSSNAVATSATRPRISCRVDTPHQ